jgi:hypothetical protein
MSLLCVTGVPCKVDGVEFHVSETNVQGVEMLAPMEEVLKPYIILKVDIRSQQLSSKRTTKFEAK